MPVRNLKYLFHEILKDVYYFEKRLLNTLSKMATGANSLELADILEKHRDQTEGQIQRLEKVFEILGEQAKGRPWPVADGIIDEGPDFVEHYKSSPALDAGLLASAQTVTHYQITRYATLQRWAAMLGMQDAAGLLDETLLEETQADQDLNALAERMANAEKPTQKPVVEAVPDAVLLSEVA